MNKKTTNRYTYTMINFSTGKVVKKIQKTEPKLKGYTCTSQERELPSHNARGERLFFDANNRPYYALEDEYGFHRQP